MINIDKQLKGIKPCPFCARQPKMYETNNELFTICCHCGAESPRDSVSKNGAKRIWNRRR